MRTRTTRSRPIRAGLRWKVCATACSALLVGVAPAAASPTSQLQKILSRLGDRSLIHGGRVEGDREWAWLYLRPNKPARGARAVRLMWEQTLVAGALRDELHAAHGPPLWGWTGADGPHNGFDPQRPYGRRFPNPSQQAFQLRLAAAAWRWHFRVVAARYLRPLQAAPLVVVETDDPRRLGLAAGEIRDFLQWRRYEGFYFEAKGDFAFASAFRGTVMGSQWARTEQLFPFPHL